MYIVRATATMKVIAPGKSCALATCPFFRASRSFLGVAFSDFSAILLHYTIRRFEVFGYSASKYHEKFLDRF